MATRLQLRTNARSRADQDSSTFPTDAQYNEYIDKAAARVWRRLVALGWIPTRTNSTLTMSGAASYALGTDVMSILIVLRKDAATTFVPLPRMTIEEIVPYTGQAGQALGYFLTGGATTAATLEFFPNPTTGQIFVNYIPRFPGFTADGDSWFGPDGSDELIILDAAMQGDAKENGEKAADLSRALNKAWDDVIQSADWLDQREPLSVRDIRGMNNPSLNPNSIMTGFNFQAEGGW